MPKIFWLTSHTRIVIQGVEYLPWVSECCHYTDASTTDNALKERTFDHFWPVVIGNFEPLLFEMIQVGCPFALLPLNCANSRCFTKSMFGLPNHSAEGFETLTCAT